MDGDKAAALGALRHALAEIEPASLPDGAAVDLLSQLGGVIAAAQAALVRVAGAAELAGVWGRADLRGATRAQGPAGAAGPCALRRSVGPGGDGDRAGAGGADGRPTPAGWIAGQARLTVTAAAALLVAARALTGLPVLAEAFRRGEVSLDHVLAVTAPLTSPSRLVALAGPVEAELTALARRAGPDQVRAAVTHWLRDADPAGVERDAVAAGRARSLSLVPVPPGCAEAHPGGWVTIAGSVSADDARTLLDALRLAARASAGSADARAPARRRADALLTVARCYLAAAGHLTTAARSDLPPSCSGTGSEVPSAGRCSSRGSASRSC
ncbi:DUF222 domain-containing protein [Pseudofrankia asymbiotica]|uniref:DUF222 domain-containing protein n=1 Tax=Pseudofrankia asymbiotica TaxID=1834516 RepID=A0A1V2IJL8_9ACTN|nr:DUF222 domain-containing protein [Pseudofrankia asymbiotica]ONH33225.1 hypothetical protein BL253_02300 [Pseudofrankia asymbiotica]